MRLVCPNCEAKYEVPDDAIPDTGRDVQCANCGHAWFQMRARPAAAAPNPAAVTAPAPEPALAIAPEAAAAEPVPAPEVTPSPAVEPDVPPEAVADPEPADVVQPDAPASVAAPVVAPVAAPVGDEADPDLMPEPEAERGVSAYGVDESVLSILREEAEREANARRAEARALETQTDLGLDALPAAKAVVPAPSAADDDFEAELKAELAAEAEIEAKPAPRRDLLPDVEEINSTLRPSDVEAEDGSDFGAALAPQRRPGFRGGFLTVMGVSTLAAGVYLAAPQIVGVMPSLDGPVESYVGYIDGLRLALDGMMRSATVAISGE